MDLEASCSIGQPFEHVHKTPYSRDRVAVLSS